MFFFVLTNHSFAFDGRWAIAIEMFTAAPTGTCSSSVKVILNVSWIPGSVYSRTEKTSSGYSMTRESEVSSGKYTYNNCYLFQSLGAEQKMAVMTILSYGFFFVLTTQWIDTTSKSDWRFVDQSFVIHTGSFYKIMISFENSRTTGHQYSGRRGPARNPRPNRKIDPLAQSNLRSDRSRMRRDGKPN